MRERRDQLLHPAYTKPELLAHRTQPALELGYHQTARSGEVDLLLSLRDPPGRASSRYVVGWMVADGESSELAKRLIADTCGKQASEPGKLTIHADRGSSMTSKPVAFLMADLGITKTHSRPHVSGRQPVFGKPLPDSEIPARVPGTFWVSAGCPFFLTRSSSPGITTSTAIPDWAFSLRPWFIMVWLRKRLNGVALFSTPPTALIPSASSASHPNPCPRRRRSGSTNHNQLRRIKLSKLCFQVSQTR